jgi:hypothetical protein
MKSTSFEKVRFSEVFRDSETFSKTLIWAFYEVLEFASITNARFHRELRGISAGSFSRVFLPIHRVFPFEHELARWTREGFPNV